MANEEKAHLKSLGDLLDKNMDWLPGRAWRWNRRILRVPFRKSPVEFLIHEKTAIRKDGIPVSPHSTWVAGN
jgi:hypothetical protein